MRRQCKAYAERQPPQPRSLLPQDSSLRRSFMCGWKITTVRLKDVLENFQTLETVPGTWNARLTTILTTIWAGFMWEGWTAL